MKIVNTSKFDTKEIKKLIKAAKGNISTGSVEFHFKNSKRNYAGSCYYKGCSFSGVFHPLVVVRIQHNNKYPLRMNEDREINREKTEKQPINMNGCQKLIFRKNRRPKYTVHNHKELLLCLIAHELYHLHLHRTRKKQSEIGCEFFAFKKLLEYRENKKRGVPLYPRCTVQLKHI